MRLPAKFLTAAALSALVATSACTTDPETGQQRLSKAAIGGIGGAVGGYLLGDLVGGRRDRTEKILGAGIGGLAGAGIGAYMDKQERDLRARTAGTDVQVVRQGDDLLLNLPSGITFAYNSSQVQPQFRQTLDQVADILSQYKQTYIDVYGHTDSTGSAEYNQRLSEQRATSVADYLASRGVQPADHAATRAPSARRRRLARDLALGRLEQQCGKPVRHERDRIARVDVAVAVDRVGRAETQRAFVEREHGLRRIEADLAGVERIARMARADGRGGDLEQALDRCVVGAHVARFAHLPVPVDTLETARRAAAARRLRPRPSRSRRNGRSAARWRGAWRWRGCRRTGC